MASTHKDQLKPQSDRPGGATVEQWVKRVLRFSSEYDPDGWAAKCILGEPVVYPQYGDLSVDGYWPEGAWAQSNCDSSEFIEIEYEEKVYIERVDIYEILNAGAVTRIAAIDSHGTWITLWDTDRPEIIRQSRIFSPPIEKAQFQSNQLRLELDCTAANAWCELDAVKLTGKHMLVDAPLPLTTLSDDLRVFVNNPQFSDCQFNIAGHTIHAHCMILAARSDYFRAMFTSEMEEGDGKLTNVKNVNTREPIPMPDISETAFVGMMQYLYTNTIDSTINLIYLVELIRVADRFQLSGLQRLSHYNLVDEITVDNVIEVYREATEKLPVLEQVKKTCLHFISGKMDQVSHTLQFCSLSQDVMLEIVQEAATRMHRK